MKLLDLAILLKDQVVELFPKKVAIIVLYGSVAQRTENKFSDLDMYAIVDEQKDTSLPWEFIYNNHTVDFWKINWQQAEMMASGKKAGSPWTVAAALFTNGKILYTRSDSDKMRFNTLATKTQRIERENQSQIITGFNYGYSHLEEIKLAKRMNDLLSARWAAWQLINKGVSSLSLLNNAYVTKNWGSNLQEVFQFPIIPQNLKEVVTILCTTNNYEEMIRAGRELMHSLRKLIRKRQQTIRRNQTDEKKAFANYVSMKAYINKILSACQKRDILAASYAATELQIWIAEELAQFEGQLFVNVDKFNLFEEIKEYYHQLKLPDLMEGISQGDFLEIEKKAKQLDLQLLTFCRNQNAKIPSFTNKEELKKYLNKGE